jgi:hypothetical protein
MDFSRVELSDKDQAFQRDLRAFLKEIVTDEVITRDRETGENFDEGVHLALADGATSPPTSRTKPMAVSVPCAGASGSWRSAGHTPPGSTGAPRPWLRAR